MYQHETSKIVHVEADCELRLFKMWSQSDLQTPYHSEHSLLGEPQMQEVFASLRHVRIEQPGKSVTFRQVPNQHTMCHCQFA